MDQPNHLPRRPDSCLHIPILKDHFPPLPTHQVPHFLKFPCATLALNLLHFLRQPISEQPRRIPPSSEHQLRVRLVCLHDGLFYPNMYRRFHRTHEPRAHIDALRSQRQCRRQTLAIRKPPTRYEGHLQRLPCSGQEDEICDVALADMTRALKPVYAEEVNAKLDRALGVSDARALMNHNTAMVFQESDDGSGGVAGSFDDADTGVDDRGSVGLVIRRYESGEECDVHAEWLGG